MTVLPEPVAAQLERALDVAGALLCATLCYYGIEATILHYVEGYLPDKLFKIANWYLINYENKH